MALAANVKTEVIQKYARHTGDTGSSEVQIAVLSQRILQLQEHFKANAQDFHSRRGLLTMVAKRRRLLKYLKVSDPERYKTLIASLGLRH